MPINFVVSGSSLIVTVNGEQLPAYSLYSQVPKYTTSTNVVSFYFADGRFLNNILFTDLLFADVPFSGTKTQLESQLIGIFTVTSGGGGGTLDPDGFYNKSQIDILLSNLTTA